MHPEFVEHGSFAHLKLGRKPVREDTRTLLLAKYVDRSALPPIPPTLALPVVPSYPMFGNDHLGDCLLEGTRIVAPERFRGYRAPYDGPAVEILTESGKRLAVTRNHAVLTARGFARACDLREGEYLISSDVPESVGIRIDDNFDDVPARVEEVFETHYRVSTAVGVERRMSGALDFDGDACFFQGEIDVVDTNRFLDGGDDALSGEVERHLGLRLSGESRKTLNSEGALFPHLRRVLTPASRILSGNRAGFALLERHVAVPKLGDLAHRAYLHASIAKPSAHQPHTDPELPGELLSCLPGLVTTDRIREIRYFTFSGHVYDFSTVGRWYIADGIIAHNCTLAAAGHMIQAWTEDAGALKTPADSDVEAAYWETGTPPAATGTAGGPTDDGRDEISVLNFWRNPGVGGDTIGAYASVDPADEEMVRAAMFLFGGVYTGIALPVTAQGQSGWDLVGDGKTGDSAPGSWGGHAVPYEAYDVTGVQLVTWGGVLDATWAFHAAYTEEVYAIISPDALNTQGLTDQGVDVEQLTADLAAVTSPQKGKKSHAKAASAVHPSPVKATSIAEEHLEPLRRPKPGPRSDRNADRR